jgi:serine/threonine protein kinase
MFNRQDVLLALKICMVGTLDNEAVVSEYLQSVDADGHPGKDVLRLALETFEISGPGGKHQCLVFQPHGMTYTNLRTLWPERGLPKAWLLQLLHLLGAALHFMHQHDVIHTGSRPVEALDIYCELTTTDISPNNILRGAPDTSIFTAIEESELSNPSPRKILSDRIIYTSHPVPVTRGRPVLVDFGAARIGVKHKGDIMPLPYRAPEVILNMEWDSKVDIWSMMVMVRIKRLSRKAHPLLTHGRSGMFLKAAACSVLASMGLRMMLNILLRWCH